MSRQLTTTERAEAKNVMQLWYKQTPDYYAFISSLQPAVRELALLYGTDARLQGAPNTMISIPDNLMISFDALGAITEICQAPRTIEGLPLRLPFVETTQKKAPKPRGGRSKGFAAQ